VPYNLCNISLIIAGSISINTKVIFLYLLQNYAIMKYDYSLVRNYSLECNFIKIPKFASDFIKTGNKTIFFSFN
jgi:hypothetical protein